MKEYNLFHKKDGFGFEYFSYLFLKMYGILHWYVTNDLINHLMYTSGRSGAGAHAPLKEIVEIFYSF